MIGGAGISVAEIIADNLRQPFYQLDAAEVFRLWSDPVTAEHNSCKTPILQKMGHYLWRHVQFRLMKLQVLGLHVDIRVMTQKLRQFSRPAATRM